MKRLTVKKGFLLAVAALALSAPLLAAPTSPSNEYLIKLHSAGPADLADAVAAAGGTLLGVYPEIGYARAISGDAGFASQLGKSGGIQAVDQDIEVQWIPAPDVQVIGGPSIAASGTPTGASFYPCQWNLRQINAPAAWTDGYLGAGVKVAVLDTGVDPFHQDLSGHIDVPNSISMLASSPCGAFDVTTIFDLNFHGSFVSGLITTNALGSTGVANLSQVVGVKVLNCLGSGSFSAVIAGIIYAANLADVDIINMSLGADFPKSAAGGGPLVAALNKAVNYAESQGKLVVSAAGNAGVDMDHDGNTAWVPAQSGTGIAAYATNNLEGLASYSNHGVSSTWVGAPGGDSPNTAPALPGCTVNNANESLVISVCSSFVCGANNFYVLSAGTSFSSPPVAGVAALVDGKHGGALRGAQLQAILAASADDLGKPGIDNTFSHGRVNAGNAVDH